MPPAMRWGKRVSGAVLWLFYMRCVATWVRGKWPIWPRRRSWRPSRTSRTFSIIIDNKKYIRESMSRKDHLINDQNLVNFIAGLLGGFISVTICNPLDIARTRLNVLVSFSTWRPLRVTRATNINTLTSLMLSEPYGSSKVGRATTPVLTFLIKAIELM